jgi:hypothetical protein
VLVLVLVVALVDTVLTVKSAWAQVPTLATQNRRWNLAGRRRRGTINTPRARPNFCFIPCKPELSFQHTSRIGPSPVRQC